MNCNSVREILAVMRPDSHDAVQPECASALTHLEQCAECRGMFENQQRADRELTRAMQSVAVPPDLKSRLLVQLATQITTAPAAAPVTAAAGPTTTITAAPAVQPRTSNRSWNRRRAATVVAAALLCTVFGSWWVLHATRKPSLSIDDLVAISHAQSSSVGFQQSFQLELPVHEIRVPSQPKALRTHSLQHLKREIGASITYKVPLAGGAPLTVILVVVDLKKVLVPDLNTVGKSFQTASIAYPKPNGYATKIWQSDNCLYICYVISRNPQAIDRLRNQSSTT